MKIDRWNCGELRRYHHPSGAKLCVQTPGRRASIIPASCHHISVVLDRQRAAAMLRDWRSQK